MKTLAALILILAQLFSVSSAFAGESNVVAPRNLNDLATSANWAFESNQADAQLGYTVASAGDVNGDGFEDILVSMPYYDNGNTDEGRVLVFYGSSTGLNSSADWSAEGGQDNAHFGMSAASAGDFNGDGYADIIIGAPHYDNGNTDEGGVFVFFGSSTGLSSTANWSVEGAQDNAYFGTAVASAGDVNGDGYADIVVGAPGYTDNPGTEDNEGGAFVYYGGSTPDTTPDWSADSDQASASLGSAVAPAGDFNGDGYADLIIGAYLYDNGSYTDDGSAFVWLGSASGLSTSGADWTATGGQNNAHLGVAVTSIGDVNGDRYSDLAVGASEYTDTTSSEGRVFVYHGSNTPDSASDWTADGEQANAALGSAIAPVGDVNGDGYADLLVGAPQYDDGSTDEGGAFLWFGSSAGLNRGRAGTPANAQWTASGGQANSKLGSAVAIADVNRDGYSDVLVGSPGYANPSSDEGQAQAFYGESYSLSGTSDRSWLGDQSSAGLGEAVGTAGDVNGDGYDDIFVAAWRYDSNGLTNNGRVYVYHGSAAGPGNTPNWTSDGTQDSEEFGIIAGTAGDVNGDGYDDLLVAGWHYSNTLTNEGQVSLYFGSASGLSATADWTIYGGTLNAELGAVSTAGDVNGDGYSDVIVGARRYRVGNDEVGAAFVFYGSPNGLNTTPDWRVISDQADSRFGNGIGSAGDVNGDGYDDIIVGAHFYNNPYEDEGKVFVWYGSAHGVNNGVEGTPSNAAWSARGNQVSANFGYSVGAGDVNGDGYADVFAVARDYDNGQTNEGAFFVWYGSASGLSCGNGCPVVATSADWWSESNQPYARLGYAYVDSPGDVNGDGFDDLIVGALLYNQTHEDGGAAFLWHGSANGLSCGGGCPADVNTSDWAVYGTENRSQLLGGAVGTAGDVNGDGYDDVIIGAVGTDDGALSGVGSAYVFYGNSSDGLNILPEQHSADNSALVHAGGQVISPNSMRLSTRAHIPFGRNHVRIQWEIKPQNTPFDGTNLGTSSWQDSTVAEITLNELITGLNSETRYHWRIRIQAQPLNANNTDLVTYQSRWVYGEAFLTALSGEQSITSTGTTNLLGQASYVNVNTLGALTGLTLRSYPDTAHPQEDFASGGDNILDRYYTLTPNAGASGYNLELCLEYDENDVPSGFTEDQLRLCRWSGTGWICFSRSSSSDTNSNLVCAAGVTAFSDWVIGANVGPNAIEVLDFQAQPVSTANLSWFALLASLPLLGWAIRRRRV